MTQPTLSRYNFEDADWVFLVKASIYSSMIAVQVQDLTRQGRNVTNEDMERFREEAETIADMWADQEKDRQLLRYQLSRKEVEKNAARSCFNCGVPGCAYGHCHPWDTGHPCFQPRPPK